MTDRNGIESTPRRLTRGVLVAAVTGSLLASAPVALAADIPGGFLSQPTGRSSCINDDGSSHCLQGRGFGSSFGITIDPAGQHAYVSSFSQPNAAAHPLGSLTVLDRFPAAASLLQPVTPNACATTDGLDDCQPARGLLGSLTSALTPDGLNVYVATQNGLAAFQRSPDNGRVTQLSGFAACQNESGAEGCALARMVQNASSIVVSPDGRYVYVAAYGPTPPQDPLQPTRSGVAVFQRNAVTGVLTQLTGQAGCVAEDGASGCTPAAGLLGADTLALAPDGKTLYVGAIRLGESDRQIGSVVALSVDPASGALTPILGHGGCVAEGPVSGCDEGRGMLGVTSVIAPDNKTVYAVGNFSSAIAVLRRATNGRIFQPTTGSAGADGCTSAAGTDGCATAPSLSGARSAVASHDGFHVYVAGGSAVSSFMRAQRGRLVQLQGTYGCVGQGRSGARCFPSHGLIDAQSIAIDPLDRSVYVAVAGTPGSATPGGGVVTFKRNASPPPLTVSAKLQTVSCRAKVFVVDLKAKSPLAVQFSATIDRHSVGTLPAGSSLRLKIEASAYKPGTHRVRATVRDITGRVRNTATSFRRCRSH